MILGIDEVGRGPWAGPMVVGAVVLGEAAIDGLTDSKKLTKKRRESLNEEIIKKAAAAKLGWVSAGEIDEIGLAEALRLATRRAVEQIKVPYHEIIIDGTINLLSGTTKEWYVTTLAKADLLIPSVSAASIIAKVARDEFMALQDDIYAGYGFKSHVGYGVAAHRAAIEKLGVTPLHRLSFAPLNKYQSSGTASSDSENLTPKVITDAAASRQIGDAGENAAASYLQQNGHEIVERNWKTKFCEIDIISRLGSTLYFTEVKHRKTDKSGDGLAAITPKKLHKMKFAVQVYLSAKHAHGAVDVRLAAISTSGQPAAVKDYLEII